ncbi:hypothetical protein K2173_000127 [Erythroxylum novogranatense]|uniref:Protein DETOXIFICATION n=1 Tax=Erythroxylum novogranatense TaxID=1862640 RepID=A0AAV8SPH2_9ROSI|nr:hypothetical protein K2173_000127 [Erythroxylum novogranatense]
MATRLSNHLFASINSQQPNRSLAGNRSCRQRVTVKPSPRKTSTTVTPAPKKPEPSATASGPVNNSDKPRPRSGSFFHLRDRFQLKFDELGLEILSIALPAALALAADPIASLVDTAFVGHIGSVELAAVGVSVSIFNLVSKLFNVPLLNITTSFVAEEQAKRNGDDDLQEGKKFLPSVSTSLALAAGVGIVETVALAIGSGFLLNLMGIAVDSPMRGPAECFLTLRAYGAPAIVIALAAQGAFRGFKDTETPLYAIGAGNLLNVVLDPILIFLFGFGVGGAAVATVISEYLIAFILLWELNGKVLLISPDVNGSRIMLYLNSGGLLIGRSIAVLLTMTLSTSLAAREGPVPMAGHQICMQIWLAVSLLNDALAIAGQALLANGYSQGSYEQARQVVYKVLQIGLGTGIALGFVLSIGFGTFSSLFSSDSEVLEIAQSGILFVAGSQPMNALAFVIDGLYYGVSDFSYAAYSMVCSQFLY